MKKNRFNLHCKMLVACTVALTVTLLFFTAQVVQAQGITPGDADHLTVRSEQHEDVGDGGEGAAGQQVLDGGDTLVIEAGGEIKTTGVSGHGVDMSGGQNEVTNSGRIEATGDDADGIHSEGEGVTITNEVDGEIRTEDGDGIYVETDLGTDVEDQDADGGNNIITNNGKIDAEKDGIYTRGHNAKVTNNGEVDAHHDGIDLWGDHNEVTNNGNINAGWDGINLWGNDAIIMNIIDKVIIAERTGIYSKGDRNIITNYGRITAGLEGIYSEGDDAKIFNYGSISVNETEAQGIYSDGDGTEITNFGSILAAGREAAGIYSDGDYVTITNGVDGTITTHGDFRSDGIYLYGEYGTINNFGSILITGETSYGISLEGDDTSEAVGYINNYGSITTETWFGKGINSDYHNAIITNYGTIKTGGYMADGIKSVGNNVTIINEVGATIETDENNNGTDIVAHAQGIYSKGAGTTITNKGSILTWDHYSAGIRSEGNNNIITNGLDGTIETNGEESHGIYAGGSDTIINNYGLISAIGYNSYAIKGGGGMQTLNLFSGSEITGNIDLGAGNDIITAYCGSTVNGDIQFGAGDDMMTVYTGATFNGAIDFDEGYDTLNVYDGNYALTFADVEGGSDGNAVPDNIVLDPSLLCIVVPDPDPDPDPDPEPVPEPEPHADSDPDPEPKPKSKSTQIVIMDKTGQAVKGATLNGFTTGLHGVINNRLNRFKPKPIKLASLRIEPGMLAKPKQPQVWGDVFHSYRKRDDDGRIGGYDHKYRGFTGGFERTYNKIRAGILGGYSQAVTETHNNTSQTKSNSYFTGIYGQYDFGRIKLAASLIGGYEDHDNDRYVTDNMFGAETARADFGSFFLSPSVTLLAEYKIAQRLSLRPSATVTYSAGWYDDYQEHGTTRINLEIDSRTIQTLSPQLQVAAVYQITEWCELEVNAGGNARYTDSGTFSGNLGGSDFRSTASGDDNVYSAQYGAYLGADITDKLELYVNAQFYDATGGETQDFFMAGLKFSF